MNRVEIPVNENAGIVLSAKIKLQEKQLQTQMASVHASQAAANLSQTSSEIYKHSALSKDIANKDLDGKIVISELPEQLREIKNELKELLTMGLPYREFVEYRGLLKMIDKYENKFTDAFGKNAFLMNDIANFSEHAINRATSGEPESYHNLTRYAHALSPMEKMAFRISTASSNVLTRVEYAAENVNTSIKSGFIAVGEKAISISDKAITLYTDTKDGVRSLTTKATDAVIEKLDHAREKGANVLNKTKDLFLGFARKGLIATFTGYQLGKMLAESTSDAVKNSINDKIEMATMFKDYLVAHAQTGYDNAHNFVSDKVDSALYTAVAAKTFTQAIGMEVKSGFNRLGDAISNTKDNISQNQNKLMEQHSVVGRKRLSH